MPPTISPQLITDIHEALFTLEREHAETGLAIRRLHRKLAELRDQQGVPPLKDDEAITLGGGHK